MLALGASVLVHAGVGGLARVSGIVIVPAAGSCRVGELIHFEAIVRTPLGPAAGMAGGASWSIEPSGGRPSARHLGGGLFRCEEVGTARVLARADSGTASAELAGRTRSLCGGPAGSGCGTPAAVCSIDGACPTQAEGEAPAANR